MAMWWSLWNLRVQNQISSANVTELVSLFQQEVSSSSYLCRKPTYCPVKHVGHKNLWYQRFCFFLLPSSLLPPCTGGSGRLEVYLALRMHVCILLIAFLRDIVIDDSTQYTSTPAYLPDNLRIPLRHYTSFFFWVTSGNLLNHEKLLK